MYYRKTKLLSCAERHRQKDDELQMDIRVVLADDHAAIRRALRQLLEIQANITVIGEAKDGLDVVKQVGQLCPDIVVLDVSMPGFSSFETVQKIRLASGRTKVIVLSMYLSRAACIGCYACRCQRVCVEGISRWRTG